MSIHFLSPRNDKVSSIYNLTVNICQIEGMNEQKAQFQHSADQAVLLLPHSTVSLSRWECEGYREGTEDSSFAGVVQGPSWQQRRKPCFLCIRTLWRVQRFFKSCRRGVCCLQGRAFSSSLERLTGEFFLIPKEQFNYLLALFHQLLHPTGGLLYSLLFNFFFNLTKNCLGYL